MFKNTLPFKFYITDKIFKLYLTEEKFMCGIVGYIGYDNAKELLLSGLEKLEYRGMTQLVLQLQTIMVQLF